MRNGSPLAVTLRILCAGIALAAAIPAQQMRNALKNSGFERPPLEEGWILDPAVAGKGLAIHSYLAARSGRSLRLIPNENNTTGVAGGSFGLAQGLPVSEFRGKALYYGSWVRIQGEAVAVIRLVALSATGGVTYRELRHSSLTSRPVLLRDIMDVPADETLLSLLITLTVEGSSGAAYFDDVFVSPDIPSDWDAALGTPSEGPPIQASVEVQAGNELRKVPRSLYGMNTEWIWGGHGIWNAELKALDPSLIRLTRDLGTSVLRFPGGTFADYYHWEYGIGERTLRPLRPSLPGAFGILSPNDFGIDEFLEFCRETNSESMITVNVSTGSAAEAAAWVRYANNGQRYVKYWEIGNELYVDHSLLDPRLRALDPDTYARIFLEYARAMRAVDPTIKIGAIVDFNYGLTTYRPYPLWTERVLELAGPEIDFLSVHNGFAPALGEDVGWNARTVYASMLAAPVLIRRSLQQLAERIERITGKDSKIAIAVSEWGPYFAQSPQSRYVDHLKTLGSGLYTASVLAALVESDRTDIANGFKLVDQMTSGWIGIRNREFVPKGPYFALQLFTQHFGSSVLRTNTEVPGYESRSLGWIDAVPYVPWLEVTSSRGDDGRLYLMAINKHFDRAVQARITLQGFCPSGPARAWTLSGTALDANTGTDLIGTAELQWAEQQAVEPGGRIHLGGPGEIGIDETQVQIPSRIFNYEFQKASVTALAIDGEWQPCLTPLDKDQY